MKTVIVKLTRKKTASKGVARYDEVVPKGQKPILNSVYFQSWADPKDVIIAIGIYYQTPPTP